MKFVTPSSPITTSKKSTSLTFYLYFFSFIYILFSSHFLSISFTNSSYSFSLSILTIIKLSTFPVLMKSFSNSFIMAWNIASKFVKPKNMTIGSNDPSGIIKDTFHSSSFFILTLLQFYLKSNFVNTFLVPIFLIISKIRSNR